MGVDISVDEPTDQAPTVIVPVAAPTDNSSMPIVMDLVERVTRLESALTQTNETVAEVAIVAESAEMIAENASDEAIIALEVANDADERALEATEIVLETAEETGVLDTVLEETETSIVPDTAPSQTHWMFRPMSEWRQKIGKS